MGGGVEHTPLRWGMLNIHHPHPLGISASCFVADGVISTYPILASVILLRYLPRSPLQVLLLGGSRLRGSVRPSNAQKQGVVLVTDCFHVIRAYVCMPADKHHAPLGLFA